ncbi:MAG: protein kinase [Candidatus Omnitrophica bacterium]|nr:protein kinase [Candidatus Omnitrophota bacterium]
MEFKKGDTLSFDSGWSCYVREVKEGGMGRVYICSQRKYGTGDMIFKTFKDLLFEKNKRIHDSFVNECRIWISLGRHPFIVEAKSIETVNGQPFVQMGRIYKRNLRDAIINFKLPYNVTPAIRLAMEICLAMIYANRKIPGFVHRDLKPTNIMLGFSTPFVHLYRQDKTLLFKDASFGRIYVQVAVSDFGLSRAVMELQDNIVLSSPASEGNNTLAFSKLGTICGTPPYMSPEQCLGQQLDQRSDIYSFGCIFYEILTGRLVFNAATAEDFLKHHLYSLPRNIKSINPAVPDVIAGLIMRCLEKDADKRFNSFVEVYEVLRNSIRLIDKIEKIYSEIFKDVLYIYSQEGYVESEIRKLLESAYKLLQLGQDTDAKRDLEKAKNFYPARMGMYYFSLVRFCFPIGLERDKRILKKIQDYTDTNDEIGALKRTINADPEYAPIVWSPYEQLYDRYMRMDKEEEAFRVLEAWLAKHKNNPKVYGYLGEYYVSKNEMEKAIEYLRTGESLFNEGEKHYSYARSRCGHYLSEAYFKIGKEELALSMLLKHKYFLDLVYYYSEKSNSKLVFEYLEKYLAKEHETSIFCKYKNADGSYNFDFASIYNLINGADYVKIDFGNFYLRKAYALECEGYINKALKLYAVLLNKCLAVPPTKIKPRKDNRFRKHLPMVIKALENKVNILQGKLKDSKVVLLVVNGPMKGHTFVLKGMDEILIGREPGMNVFLPEDEYVSRRHARILLKDDEFLIEDLESANGTYINGSKLGVAGVKLLKIDSSITVGKTTLVLNVNPQSNNPY